MAQAIPRGYGSQCQGGAGVRGFSRSGKPWGGLSPPGRFFLGIEITKAIDALELLLPDGIRKSEQDQHKAQLLD